MQQSSNHPRMEGDDLAFDRKKAAVLLELEFLEADKLRRQATQKETSTLQWQSTLHKGKGRKTFRAQELWFAIVDAQIETGTPYMLYKDACNLKSNQQNLGI